MNYGIGYQGSKNRIAKDIMSILPSGERFVDLFAGGCAMSHCAMLSGKYNRFLANDIYGRLPQMFKDAIEGKYANERRWISRDDFFKLKDSDIYVRLCFSFGNNQRDYMYSTNLEPYKKACHYAIVFDEWDEFKRLCPETVESAMNALDGLPLDDWKQIKERRLKFGPSVVNEVKIIESLQRLERLQSLESLEVSGIDYREYEHQVVDVVYCDPPYKGTKKYDGNEFDHNAFYEWVRTRDYPVYFSEYNAPDDFTCIWHKEKTSLMGGGNSARGKKAIEKLFVHSKWEEN